MSDANHSQTNLRKPAIVAVVAGLEDLRVWRTFSGVADLFELRLDRLLTAKPDLTPADFSPGGPFVITARDSIEGGAPELTFEDRLSLLRTWLDIADWIDVEAGNLLAYAELVETARTKGKRIVISYHNFERTPDAAALEKILDNVPFDGRFVFKAATRVNTWQDLSNLTNFLLSRPDRDLALMGMGPLGKLSRLLLPAFGSRLVYASCAKSVVPGQWPVETLRTTLDALEISTSW
jgi:3-dehydroquinate dehydratase-1